MSILCGVGGSIAWLWRFWKISGGIEKSIADYYVSKGRD
jgi:hypothetical protein